eukprot:750549-Hanusia_phi.AAC.4
MNQTRRWSKKERRGRERNVTRGKRAQGSNSSRAGELWGRLRQGAKGKGGGEEKCRRGLRRQEVQDESGHLSIFKDLISDDLGCSNLTPGLKSSWA